MKGLISVKVFINLLSKGSIAMKNVCSLKKVYYAASEVKSARE